MRFLYDGEANGGASNAGTPAPSGAPAGGTANPAGTPGANGPTDWRSSLPEDVRGHTSIGKFANVEQLARGYVSASAMIGKDPSTMVVMPAADDAAGRTALLQRLGAPKDVAGYKFTVPEKVDVKIAGPETGLATVFKTAAAAANLLPAQAQSIYGAIATAIQTSYNERQSSGEAAAKTGEAALRAKWGGGYDSHVALAGHAINKAAVAAGVDAAELKGAIENAGLGTNPVVLQALAYFGSLVQDDTTGGGGRDKPSGFGVGTPAAAKSKAMEYQQLALNEKNPSERRRLSNLATEQWALASPAKK